MGETERELGQEVAALDLPFDSLIMAALTAAPGEPQRTALAQAFPGVFAEWEENRLRAGSVPSDERPWGSEPAWEDVPEAPEVAAPALSAACSAGLPELCETDTCENPTHQEHAYTAHTGAHPLYADPSRPLTDAERARWRRARRSAREAGETLGCDPEKCRWPLLGPHAPTCSPVDPILLEGLRKSLASDQRSYAKGGEITDEPGFAASGRPLTSHPVGVHIGDHKGSGVLCHHGYAENQWHASGQVYCYAGRPIVTHFVTVTGPIDENAEIATGGGALASNEPDRPGACPDGGTCGHGCGPGRCWRVRNASPLGAAGWGDEWPQIIRDHDARASLPRPRRAGAIDLGDDPDGDNTPSVADDPLGRYEHTIEEYRAAPLPAGDDTPHQPGGGGFGNPSRCLVCGDPYPCPNAMGGDNAPAHEPECDGNCDGACFIQPEPVTGTAETMTAALDCDPPRGAIHLEGDNIVKPWRYR
jgi:hypothetical protein